VFSLLACPKPPEMICNADYLIIKLMRRGCPGTTRRTDAEGSAAPRFNDENIAGRSADYIRSRGQCAGAAVPVRDGRSHLVPERAVRLTANIRAETLTFPAVRALARTVYAVTPLWAGNRRPRADEHAAACHVGHPAQPLRVGKYIHTLM